MLKSCSQPKLKYIKSAYNNLSLTLTLFCFWLLHLSLGTNLVLGPPKKFYRRYLSGTLRDVHWYHLGDPKKVPGAPSQGFLTFLGFDKNITKIEIWLSYPHFWADFQVSYHFGKLLTARSQGFTASKNQSLDQ